MEKQQPGYRLEDVTTEDIKNIRKNKELKGFVKSYVVGEGIVEHIPIIAMLAAEMGATPQFSTDYNTSGSKEEYSKYYLEALCNKAKLGTLLRTFEGCRADLIYNRHKIEKNEYLPIQIKYTLKPENISQDGKNTRYCFKLDKNYPGQLIIFHCLENNKMWAIPFDIIKEYQKHNFRIYDSSKKRNGIDFSEYEANSENILAKIHEYHTLMIKEDICLEPITKEEANKCVSENLETESNGITDLSGQVPLMRAPIQGTKYDFVLFHKEYFLRTQTKTPRTTNGIRYRDTF